MFLASCLYTKQIKKKLSKIRKKKLTYTFKLSKQETFLYILCYIFY